MSARIRSASLVNLLHNGSEATAIAKLAGRCHPDRGQSRKSSGEWRVKFADLVVVLVEGARPDLGTLIARYEVYKLERQRYRWEASAQK